MFHCVVLIVKLSLQSAYNVVTLWYVSTRQLFFFMYLFYAALKSEYGGLFCAFDYDSSVFDSRETSSSLETRKLIRKKSVNSTSRTGALLSHQPLTDTLEQINKPQLVSIMAFFFFVRDSLSRGEFSLDSL